jgi:hypothetical protein
MSYKDITTTLTVSSIRIRNPNTPIINSAGTRLSGSDVEIWNASIADTVKDNNTTGVAGSFKPVATDLQARSTALTVAVTSDDHLRGIPFTLYGTLNGQRVVSQESVSQGTSFFTAIDTKRTGIPWGYAGDIQWSIKGPTTPAIVNLNTSRIELYGISSSLPSYFITNPGLSVNFLRLIALPAPSTDYKTYIANATMNNFAYKYDTYSGSSSFASSCLGGTFRLNYWIAMIRHTPPIRVNCYDQAALVQLCLTLQLGNPSNTWAYMDPYGFINTTDLIGWGRCNNPGFRNNIRKIILPINDPGRTHFANHAFITTGDKVIDSTCGPHIGSETTAAYVSSCIDTVTTRYSPPGFVAGTVSNISNRLGIASLNPNINFSMDLGDLPPSMRERVSKAMDLALVPDAPAVQHSNADFSGLAPLVLSHFPGRLDHQSTEIGPQTSETRWIFTFEQGAASLSIAVNKDHETTVRWMQEHLTTYQAPVDQIFVKPASGIAKGQLNLESDSNLSIWIRGNLFFVLEILSPGPSLGAISNQIDGYFAISSVDPSLGMTPLIRDLVGPTEPLEVGDEFTVHASVSISYSIFV